MKCFSHAADDGVGEEDDEVYPNKSFTWGQIRPLFSRKDAWILLEPGWKFKQVKQQEGKPEE